MSFVHSFFPWPEVAKPKSKATKAGYVYAASLKAIAMFRLPKDLFRLENADGCIIPEQNHRLIEHDQKLQIHVFRNVYSSAIFPPNAAPETSNPRKRRVFLVPIYRMALPSDTNCATR